jgi:hypothetical protein
LPQSAAPHRACAALTTAKALSLTVPQTLLALADDVIEMSVYDTELTS